MEIVSKGWSLATHDPYAALRSRNYRLYAVASVIDVIGFQMLAVAVGWELYERTLSPLALGYAGLVGALPPMLLSLPAGQIADRYSRKFILMATKVVVAVAALGLYFLSVTHGPVPFIYACLFLSGIARAFSAPAGSALLPQLVPPEALANAVTWRSSWFQASLAVGPALGGLVIGARGGADLVYLLTAACAPVVICLIVLVTPRFQTLDREPVTFRSMLSGVRFVWDTRVILATITLDLFAVLFGGATTLLPVYARDILHVGPQGLGLLRAAPSLGAVCTALSLAYLPPMDRAGRTLLFAVAGFGIATIVFGLSRQLWLSLVMLFLTGVFDNVSVVVRSTLVQLLTPDALRGRVLAFNFVFISASNELGGFESGLVANWLGPVFSVVGGGVGTLLVVAFVALAWPEVRQLGALSDLSPADSKS